MSHLRKSAVFSVLLVGLITTGCSDGKKSSVAEQHSDPNQAAAPAGDSESRSENQAGAVGDGATDPGTAAADPLSGGSTAGDAPVAVPKTDSVARSLPMPGDESPSDSDNQISKSGNEALEVADEPPTPEEVVRAAFAAPPGARSMTKDGGLWVDRERKRVFVDGYVAITRGALEMLACPVGTKEHESIVATLAKSSEVHAALLAVGAAQGTPVRFRPEFLPPTGQVIRVWATWRDTDGKFHATDARQWIQDYETEKAMNAEFVFAGSDFWKDPDDGKEYYRADAGDMICVSNFASAMIDVSINSSADADSLQYIPFEDKIPERYTPVRLVLVPVPQPTDGPTDEAARAKRMEKPQAEVLPSRG